MTRRDGISPPLDYSTFAPRAMLAVVWTERSRSDDDGGKVLVHSSASVSSKKRLTTGFRF